MKVENGYIHFKIDHSTTKLPQGAEIWLPKGDKAGSPPKWSKIDYFGELVSGKTISYEEQEHWVGCLIRYPMTETGPVTAQKETNDEKSVIARYTIEIVLDEEYSQRTPEECRKVLVDEFQRALDDGYFQDIKYGDLYFTALVGLRQRPSN